MRSALVDPPSLGRPDDLVERGIGPAPSAARVVLFELSLETTSLEQLEAASQKVTLDWAEKAWTAGTDELALIRTCHRVELVVRLHGDGEVARWRERLPGPGYAWRTHADQAAVRHLFRVAAGLESLALGEAEVREQVRRAASTVRSRAPRPVLRSLLVAAADSAREQRPNVPTGASIAAIAAERLLIEVARAHPKVVIVGAGLVARQVAETLAGRADVVLLYHTSPPDPRFLRDTASRAEPIASLRRECASADALITAAKSAGRLLEGGLLGPRQRPIVILDLGLPRNVDPAWRDRAEVRLIDLEDLRRSTRAEPPRSFPDDPRWSDQLERSWSTLERLRAEESADALWRRAEEARRTELAVAEAFLGPLSVEQKEAVDRLTRRLVTRLVGPTAARLKALPAGPEGEEGRRRLLELLGLPSPEP